MYTLDERPTTADPDAVFRVAADVERWPEILPHYRWVRFRRRDGVASGLVEMAAWRHFGPIGFPTWWVSEMTADQGARRIRYRHVEGITRGMDVLWEIVPDASERVLVRIIHEWTGPRWPLIGGVAARAVIGPHFVSHIARRTLLGVTSAAETEPAPDGRAPLEARPQEAVRRGEDDATPGDRDG